MPEFRHAQRALIIGGTSGIGRAAAVQLLTSGTEHAVITGRRHEAAKEQAYRIAGTRAVGVGVKIGWSQAELENFSEVVGRARGGWDVVLIAAGGAGGAPQVQEAEGEGVRWLMGQAVNEWLNEDGALGVITTTLADPLPPALRALRPWVVQKRLIADRAAQLGRTSAGVTVLDFGFTRVRGTEHWQGVPSTYHAAFAELERVQGLHVDAPAAGAFVAFYLRGRRMSGRLVPRQRDLAHVARL